MKTLGDYASALGAKPLAPEAASLPIADVSNNSSFASSGPWLFCAIPGSKRDGHDFLPQAIANGAVAAAVAKIPEGLPQGFPLLFVEDPHMAWALACETFFSKPAGSMTLAAVTGTNGKTSIAYIMRQLLQCIPGARCGLLSTVVYDTYGGQPQEASRTTPDAYEFQRLLAEMRANSCTHVALELSSHGLHQRRSGSAKFKAAVFTNLTGDHLDYHGDMESYYQAKKLLFSSCLAPDGAAVINIDDAYGARLQRELSKTLPRERLVSCSKANAKAACFIKAMKLSDSHSEVEAVLFGEAFKFRSQLIGEHNVYNSVSAAAAARFLGAPLAAIAQTLSGPIAAPGRLEGFALPSGAFAFVDYAHTDDALFRALSALKPLCKGSLITVFGCGGDRDRTKRPRMGAVAARFSDLTVVTSDNPRSENPLDIIAQIRKGMPRDCRCREIPDRGEAIRSAAAEAVAGDIVLIAGKGHENYQEAAGVKIHFDDREFLRGLGAKPRSV